MSAVVESYPLPIHSAAVSRHRQLSLGVLGLGMSWEATYRPALERLGDRARVDGIAGVPWRAAAEGAKVLETAHFGSVRGLLRNSGDGVLVIEPEWWGSFPLQAAP